MLVPVPGGKFITLQDQPDPRAIHELEQAYPGFGRAYATMTPMIMQAFAGAGSSASLMALLCTLQTYAGALGLEAEVRTVIAALARLNPPTRERHDCPDCQPLIRTAESIAQPS